MNEMATDLGYLNACATRYVPGIADQYANVIARLRSAREEVDAPCKSDLTDGLSAEYKATLDDVIALYAATKKALDDSADGLERIVRRYQDDEDIGQKTLDEKTLEASRYA